MAPPSFHSTLLLKKAIRRREPGEGERRSMCRTLYKARLCRERDKMMDLVFVVDDPLTWHKENMSRNSQFLSFFL
jgi:hypothetical protein